MSWRVILISNPAKLCYQNGALVVQQDHNYRVPVEDISSIIVDNPQVIITQPLLSKAAEYAKNSTHFDTIRPLNFDMKRSRNFDTMRPFNFEVIRPPNFDMYFYHSLTFSHLDSSHDCIAAMLPFYFMSFLCHKEKHFFLPSSVQSAQII